MPRITLNQPHTHGGVHHREGATLEVDAFSAHWLVQNGIARPAPVGAEPAAKPAEEPAKAAAPTAKHKE